MKHNQVLQILLGAMVIMFLSQVLINKAIQANIENQSRPDVNQY